MLASELISMLTHTMEAVGNYVVKITEDGAAALHITSMAHVVDGEDHSIVITAADSDDIEGDVQHVADVESGDTTMVPSSGVVAADALMDEMNPPPVPEVDPSNSPETTAEIPHPNVTDVQAGG